MELLISFTDQSSSFAHGVEFGRLLQKMEEGNFEVQNQSFPVRIENKEVLTQACNAYGYVAHFGKIYFGEWIEFIGIKKVTTDN